MVGTPLHLLANPLGTVLAWLPHLVHQNETKPALTSSRFEPVPICLATFDGLDDGFGEAITFSVINVSFSGKELAQGAPDLSLDVAEAVLLLLGLDLVVNWQSRFLELAEELVSRRPLSQSLAQLASNFPSPIISLDDKSITNLTKTQQIK